MRSFRILNFLTLTLLTFILISCGQSSGLNTASSESGNGSTKSTKRTPSKIPSYSPTTNTETPTNTNTQTTAAPVCTSTQQMAQSLVNNCRPTIREASDVVNATCVNAAESLSNMDCSGLSTRVNNALRACIPEIQKYRQYVPQACIQTITQLSK